MIHVERLHFHVGDFALRDVSFSVRRGEYLVLLGKPGSGKTILLECLAGLKRLSSGTIQIGGRRVEKAEPRDRGIGYVPQDYALFSARTVRRNIEFPLRVQRYQRARTDRRVKELAEVLGIAHLLDRRTDGLSGGEQQRVALARALAAQPKILLLDEPVSALDHETREAILMELRRIQRQTGTTTIHVCHDLGEMRSVADRVGVLQEGRLVQLGVPEELSRSPANPEVARLFRLGTIHRATAEAEDTGSLLRLKDFTLRSDQIAEGDVVVLIRARKVRVLPASSHEGQMPAHVESTLQGTATVLINLRAGTTLLRAEVPHAEARALSLKEGGEVAASCPPEAVHIFPTAGRNT